MAQAQVPAAAFTDASAVEAVEETVVLGGVTEAPVEIAVDNEAGAC